MVRMVRVQTSRRRLYEPCMSRAVREAQALSGSVSTVAPCTSLPAIRRQAMSTQHQPHKDTKMPVTVLWEYTIPEVHSLRSVVQVLNLSNRSFMSPSHSRLSANKRVCQ